MYFRDINSNLDYTMFLKMGVLIAATLMSFSDVVLADDIEVSRISVTPTLLPEGFDLLGARTGTEISDVRVVLENKGYKEREIEKGTQHKPDRIEENIGCINGECLTFNGERSFESLFRWDKGNETIEVRVTSPLAGSLVYSIERTIDGSGTTMADFDTLLESARAKYGTRAQWKTGENAKAGFSKKPGYGIACWGVREGQLVAPDKKVLMCNSNPHEKNKRYADAFFFMERTDNTLEGRKVVFQLMDRQLLKDAVLPISGILEEEVNKRRAERSRKANSGASPEL